MRYLKWRWKCIFLGSLVLDSTGHGEWWTAGAMVRCAPSQFQSKKPTSKSSMGCELYLVLLAFPWEIRQCPLRGYIHISKLFVHTWGYNDHGSGQLDPLHCQACGRLCLWTYLVDAPFTPQILCQCTCGHSNWSSFCRTTMHFLYACEHGGGNSPMQSMLGESSDLPTQTMVLSAPHPRESTHRSYSSPKMSNHQF